MKPNRLIVMLKEPRPGRVKTRLGKDLGFVEAAHWYRRQALSTLRKLEDARWQTVLAVAPDNEGLMSRVWPSHLGRLPQGNGDLGRRMAQLFKKSAAYKTCIIGSDIPSLEKRDIRHCFAGLGSKDATIGPAPDGGYWLIGLRHPGTMPASFLKGVRWSTEHARADTLASAPSLSWHIGPEHADIDMIDDLHDWRETRKTAREMAF